MYADVLANSHPPYAVVGGVRDALRDTGGDTHAVTRDDALRAKAAFERTEGGSINEPASCACAGLEQAIAKGSIDPEDTVLLNITGGGYDLLRRDFKTYTLEPTRIVGEGDLDFDALESYEEIFDRTRCV
jgi:cysteate synthase